MQTLLAPQEHVEFIGLYFTELIRNFINDKDTENVILQNKCKETTKFCKMRLLTGLSRRL